MGVAWEPFGVYPQEAQSLVLGPEIWSLGPTGRDFEALGLGAASRPGKGAQALLVGCLGTV